MKRFQCKVDYPYHGDFDHIMSPDLFFSKNQLEKIAGSRQLSASRNFLRISALAAVVEQILLGREDSN